MNAMDCCVYDALGEITNPLLLFCFSDMFKSTSRVYVERKVCKR